MTGTPPEFSRLVPLTRLGATRFEQQLAATPDECAALALRFGLLALDRLTATVALERQPDETILLRASFAAAFTQECVISLDPVAGSVAEQFALHYGPPEAEPADEDGGEVAFEPLDGDAIDIGEAVAQEFSLSLPPFPHAPDAVIEIAADVEDDGPLAALARLKDPPAQR